MILRGRAYDLPSFREDFIMRMVRYLKNGFVTEYIEKIAEILVNRGTCEYVNPEKTAPKVTTPKVTKKAKDEEPKVEDIKISEVPEVDESFDLEDVN